MPYWQLFYHIVWATKNRELLLTPKVEPIIHGYLRTKAVGLGAKVFALNGWSDHVHLVASIPPSIAIAKFIGQVKAVAATKFNKSGHPEAPLYWQRSYGAFSFDKKRLPNYVQYVNTQKEHHRQGTIIYTLERSKTDGMKLIRESGPDYKLDDIDWRQEFDVYDQSD